MAKQSCWFGWLKRIFVSKPKNEKKRSRKWIWLLARLKIRQYPALAAHSERSLGEATEEQRQHALNVAVATAAAAEAAVAAVRAAAEVVRLTRCPKSHLLVHKKDRHIAATVIQSAFRAYLARKALRALKGLVKLQAIARGRAVRRQTSHMIKRFPSNAKSQSETQKRSIPSDYYGNCKDGENKLLVRATKEFGEKDIKHDCNSPRSWDFNSFSKEDVETIWLKKQEAVMKRERMKQYSFSHRERRNWQMLEEPASSKENGRRTFWVEQWADAEELKSKKITGEICGVTHIEVRNSHKKDLVEGFETQYSFPRRSFCRGKHNIVKVDSTMPNSPVLPTYTGVTESARAKLRSMSTPRQRQGFLDTLSNHNFRYNHAFSFSSSYNCDPPLNTKFCAPQQRTVSTNHVL